MKSLTLFRHAKTERDSATGLDFDRQLAERGQRDAARMGEEIRKIGSHYDLLLSSPAARAAETANHAGLAVRYEDRIYEASTDELLAIVRETDDSVRRMIMIGHNPGFERLASRLIGSNLEMPTGSLVEIELPGRWSEAGKAQGRKVRFLKPKELD